MQAGDVIARLKAALSAPTDDAKYEGVVVGDVNATITGLATCAMPSIEVLRRAAAARCNLLIADGHPLYTYDAMWAGLPGTAEGIAKSPVAQAKKALMADHGIVVVRYPTAWATARPGSGGIALASALTLTGAVAAPGGGDFALASVPATTLAGLARTAARRSAIDGIRLIGDGALPVRRVAIADGLVTPARMRAMLADPRVDAVIGGEVCEWEAGPYFHDAITAGRRAGLILLGFDASKEPLADAMAAWARPLAQMPVTALTQREPIRTVAAGA